MLSSLDKVVEIMGGQDVINMPVRNYLDWIYLSEQGVSIKAVRAIQRIMGFSNKEVSGFLDISESTLQRRIRVEARLSKDETEKAIQISEVIARGIDVFGDKEVFLAWLHTENIALGNIKPMTLMSSAIGREQIMEMFIRIEHGIYS